MRDGINTEIALNKGFGANVLITLRKRRRQRGSLTSLIRFVISGQRAEALKLFTVFIKIILFKLLPRRKLLSLIWGAKGLFHRDTMVSEGVFRHTALKMTLPMSPLSTNGELLYPDVTREDRAIRTVGLNSNRRINITLPIIV